MLLTVREVYGGISCINKYSLSPSLYCRYLSSNNLHLGEINDVLCLFPLPNRCTCKVSKFTSATLTQTNSPARHAVDIRNSTIADSLLVEHASLTSSNSYSVNVYLGGTSYFIL